MNLSAIARMVADLVPGAADVETREQPGNVYSLVCRMGGRTRSVQFDAAGLYPNSNTWAASDLWLAAEIAKELKK